jgi:hypothetical protein
MTGDLKRLAVMAVTAQTRRIGVSSGVPLPNVPRFYTLKSEYLVWRQIIWPERKADWLLGPLGALLGVFTNIANVLLRVIHPHWLLFVLGLGLVGGWPCRSRVGRVLSDFKDDRTQEAKIDSGVQCLACAVFRFCLFFCLAVLVLTNTSAGQLSTEAIAERLRSMNSKLEDISNGVANVDSKLDRVKQETSNDPRKELANRGVLWTIDAFFDAIRRGDDSTAKLFLAGRMTTDSPDSQGRPLPVILALNTSTAANMLDLLVGAGLDVNHSYEVAGALHQQRMTLLSRAIERGFTPLVAALIKRHADTNSPIQTFGAMGLTRDTYPLASAIYWKQWDIAHLLLEAGADPAAGDYAAYRQARALREKFTGDVDIGRRLDALFERLKPRGTAASRVEGELQLQDIEQKLNQVALAILRTPSGGTERRRLDAEYDQLQIKRTKLRNDLSAIRK